MPHARGPICYNCEAVSTLNECKTVTVCQNGEVCYIEKQSSTGETVYSTSCQNNNICNVKTDGRPVVGKRYEAIMKRTSSTCSKCCNDDVCNSECCDKTTVTVDLTRIKDCTDIKGSNLKSGVYRIHPVGPPGYKVYCDMTTECGGWTVFQRRYNGNVTFHNKLWIDYQLGFGNIYGEYWLGNKRLHELLLTGQYVLRIELEDWDNNTRYAMYDTFNIGSTAENYKITLGGYSGTAGDSLIKNSNGSEFSTIDVEHDHGFPGTGTFPCAMEYEGAWWYPRDCGYSNLNGAYTPGGTIPYIDPAGYVHPTSWDYTKGLRWASWRGFKYSLKSSTMMVRRK